MNIKQKTLLYLIGIPVAYALTLRLLYKIPSLEGIFTLMSISFLFFVPFIVGTLTTYLASENFTNTKLKAAFLPWIPILIFFFVTFLFAIEGWPCLLMIAPIFLISASIGGSFGVKLKKRDKKTRLQLSALTVLPFLISPVEQMIGAHTSEYKAYTYIDIKAPAEKIWSNVTRVREISEKEDQGYLTHLLNFPRPVKAELNYEGVGAYRAAIFTNGLVFHETVTEYIPLKKMSFTIKALPHEIPLTTMDEHLVVGGKYFDVLNGTYELEKLGNNSYRLHLFSNFKLTTTFNFYASWWTKNIMKDIQNNILQIEKQRAEADSVTK
ncbi:hypothetical protein [Flectobacillus roseus]|uniref:SRPBCC family protein n=1 Tax=Flectobacillus roseus TaxID=502259 RepID=A0ABT6Y2G0_9BACT|nr:hypothetical protein [Flectobacillus roseus]MDI9857747.1 hypothetical protein [Flectobacillus roseus]